MGYETAIALAVDEVPTSRPGERFVYSDINFFLLGDIVQRVSGLPLDRFAREHIFEPLGMKDTMFNPPASLVPRIAPTESCTRYGWPCQGPEMTMLRGRRARSDRAPDGWRGRPRGPVQHGRGPGDLLPHAARRRRVSERASPVAARGREDDERRRRPISKRTRGASGWDIDSAFSSNRGELLPIGSFGHTGFTGTSIWIDPSTGMFVVFLSNRVHPDGKGDVTPLARPRRDRGRRGRHGPAAGGARRRSGPAATSARPAPSLRVPSLPVHDRHRRPARGGVRAAAREARRAS